MRQDLKNERSRMLLMESAYELFIEKGFHKTTIAMISDRAGLGKGTFYLYFRDKEDVRDSLIAQKSSEILHHAIETVENNAEGLSFYDRVIGITDYIIDYLIENKDLFRFISKSLSWGIHMASGEADTTQQQGIMELEDFVNGVIRKGNVVLKDQRLFIYTIIELINSTCYNPIIYGTPVSIEEYKPYLYHMIKLMTDDQVISE